MNELSEYDHIRKSELILFLNNYGWADSAKIIGVSVDRLKEIATKLQIVSKAIKP